MAERMILVCDVCGEPATATVAIRANGKSLNKDLCRKHLDELTSGARPARRGRPRKSSLARPGRRSAAKSTAKSTAAAKTTGRRRGRPRKAAAAEGASAES